MSNTVKQLGFIPTNRGEFDTTGQTRYYKDNVVQYRNGSYICTPVGYSSSNLTAYTTDAPYQDGDTELNPNWKLMASVGLVDTEPTAGSENLVKSGGIKTAINNVAFSTNEKVNTVGIGNVPGTSQTTLMSQKGATDLTNEYNVSANNSNTEYTFAQAVVLVPASLQKSGLTIKYIDSTTHKYVEYSLKNEWSVNPNNWTNVSKVINVEVVDNDFCISDVNGNIIIEFKNGHLKTKNFDSCPKNISDDFGDFCVIDSDGNIIVQFKNGHLKTKNFDSTKVIKGYSENVQTEAFGNLSFADENGNVILEIKDGNIITKNFNSSLLPQKKPYTSVWERFKVLINRTGIGKFNNYSNSATDSPDPNSDIKEVTGVIALPESYTPNGKPTKLICFCHGTSGNVTDSQWYNNNPLMINHFVPFWLSKGYAVFDCNGVADGMDRYDNGTRSAPCGLPDTMQAYINCYKYLIENYNFEKKVYLWGCSDGGPVPLNWAFINPGSIAAIADCDSVIDLYQDAWNGSFSYLTERRQNIAERLRFSDLTGETYEHDKADIWNPFARIKEINNVKYLFGLNVPVFIASTASGSYFTSSTFHIREEFAEALINGGTICFSKWYQTFSHDDVAMGGSDVVLNDVFKWFERF